METGALTSRPSLQTDGFPKSALKAKSTKSARLLLSPKRATSRRSQRDGTAKSVKSIKSPRSEQAESPIKDTPDQMQQPLRPPTQQAQSKGYEPNRFSSQTKVNPESPDIPLEAFSTKLAQERGSVGQPSLALSFMSSEMTVKANHCHNFSHESKRTMVSKKFEPTP